MTVNELLKSESHPWSWIQGHHTRILLSEALDKSIFYEVLARKQGSVITSYILKKYEGHDEQEAVAAFIKSEEE